MLIFSFQPLRIGLKRVRLLSRLLLERFGGLLRFAKLLRKHVDCILHPPSGLDLWPDAVQVGRRYVEV